MDDQTNQPINSPAENAPVQPVSSVTPPPTPKSFLSGKIIIFIVILLVILAGGGTYFVLNSKKENPPPAISKITPKSTPVPTTDPTASWKTYTNSKYGYSIKYPTDWNIVEGESTSPEKVTFSSSASNVLDPKPALVNVIAVNKTEFNSDWVNNYGPYSYKTFEKDDKVFAIISNTYMEGSAASKEIEQLAKDTMEKMVSTFKFTSVSPTGGGASQTIDTSTWKTYQDLKTGATFKYPPSYFFSDYFFSKSGVITLFESNERKENAEKYGYEGCGGCTFTMEIDQKVKNNTESLETYFLKNGIDKSKFYPSEVNGLKALKSEEPGLCLYNKIFIDDANRVLIISGCAMQPEKQKEFQQILSTFKFTQ